MSARQVTLAILHGMDRPDARPRMERLVASVASAGIDAELLVIAAKPAAPGLLPAGPAIRIVPAERPRPLSARLELTLALAEAPAVLLLHPSVDVAPDGLRLLMEALDGTATGAVVPVALAGERVVAGVPLAVDDGVTLRVVDVATDEPLHVLERLDGCELAAPWLACTLLDRDAVLRAGPLGGEDGNVDRCAIAIGLAEQGLPVRFRPGIRVGVPPGGIALVGSTFERLPSGAGRARLARQRSAVERALGARLVPPGPALAPGPNGAPAHLMIVNRGVLGADAAEARALASGLGGELALPAREWLRVGPIGPGESLRPPRPEARGVFVGCEPAGTAEPHVIRPWGARAAAQAPVVWAPSATVASAWRGQGRTRRVVELAPYVAAGPLGPGGGGVVALLPHRDAGAAEAIAEAARGVLEERGGLIAWDVAAPVAGSGGGVREAGTSEHDLRYLAASADVVLVPGAVDPYGRLALAVADAGAVPVTGSPIALEILGDAAVDPGAWTPSALRRAIARAAEQGGDRSSRRRIVGDRCRGAAWQAQATTALEAATARPSGRRRSEPAAPVAGPVARVVCIFPDLPDPRRASGDLRWTEVLLGLRRAGHEVVVATHREHGSNGAADDLRAAGIATLALDRDGRGVEDALWLDPDVVLAGPYGLAVEYLDRIRGRAPRAALVIDSVDLHYLRARREADVEDDPILAARAQKVRRSELLVYARADVVLAVSDVERAVLERDLPGKPIVVVPNVHRATEEATTLDGRHGALFVGGFGHPPNVDAVQFLASEIVPELRRRGWSDEIGVAGSEMPASVAVTARRAGMEVLGRIDSVPDELRRRRVSIAPLRYGAGLKGKVGEALAAGVPVVGTRVAAEGFEEPERGMLVADDAVGLASAVLRLASDDELWHSLSEGGRALVDQQLGLARCDRAVAELVAAARAAAAARTPAPA